ncbi:alkaline phosphatase family protein [Sphingomonas nostoxanthinifaciens]|uniref:alkaline phosphatase family protein n=1 Tax=Sphingomonas nostoxanthinifaciens TaxID=2872652 RepID=UPI001CC1E325|nr:alkaline phosphatase family protein [Sphingomonas nostoxanthinifaciens]
MIRLVLSAAAALAATSAPAAPPAPKLVVAIAVDQFSNELYQRYRPTFTGGLKRLSDGIVFTGYQSHAATETCPGHSTILTGRHPAGTGIVANTWFDAKTGSSIYCVSVRGTADASARGPQNLRVPTYGDWLKGAQPGARVFSVSGKDRAAIMLGGHKADGVYWWNDGAGFGSSSYAGPSTPAVLAPAQAFDKALFARWKASPPELWPAPSATCAALAKPHMFGKLALSGNVPPDMAKEVESGDFMARTDFQDFLHATPLYDALTLQFADDILDREHLGHGPATDLLAVSLSATDYVGHRYGNGGAEMCVQMAALDRALGAFFQKLDGLGVPYVVVLTADHGSTDAAEREAETGVAAKRLDSGAFVGALNKAVEAQLGLAFEPIVGDDPQQLSINVGPDDALRAKVRDAAIAWLKTRPEVKQVYTADQIAAAAPPPGKPVDQLSVAERFNESYDPERSGDIQVEYAERTTFGMPRGPGDTVAGHGSPWDHDRRVPILFWWQGAPSEQPAAPAETVDIAPTLAAITHVPTTQVDGKCLTVVAGTCG